MINIKNLVKKYKKFVAVDNLSLDINDNEMFALLGLNGAGKTTTINILCTLLSKSSGEVTINGFDIDKDSKSIKEIISLSPQETAIAKNLTVKENLKLIYDLYGVKDEGVVDKLIKDFNLEEKSNQRAKNLSGGQKRRLSIALAIISNPKILFLDEPTLGLDIKARRELWKIIETLKQKMTIILTTHYLEEAEALADKVGIMSKGKLVVCGTVEEIKIQTNKLTFEEAFLELAEEEK